MSNGHRALEHRACIAVEKIRTSPIVSLKRAPPEDGTTRSCMWLPGWGRLTASTLHCLVSALVQVLSKGLRFGCELARNTVIR